MTSAAETIGINAEQALSFIRKDGILSHVMRGFEPRDEQQQMMTNVIEAYNRSKIALIEAGTGTGKSLAYLIPAILWSLNTKERTVIATHTINLQEQLINKDIPFLLQALNLEMSAVLVKGMNNYICLRKLEEAHYDYLTMTLAEQEEYQKLNQWSQKTRDGSRADLAFYPSAGMWERVGAEHDMCLWEDCPHYNQCFFIRARNKASNAQLLVANHKLLFADLAARANEDEKGKQSTAILPPYQRVIIDEAHHIEDVATDLFADQVNQLHIYKLMSKLYSDGKLKSNGKLNVLENHLRQVKGHKSHLSGEMEKLMTKLVIDLPGMRISLLQMLQEVFQIYQGYIKNNADSKVVESENEHLKEHKLRLLPMHYTLPTWEDVLSRSKVLIDQGQKYAVSLSTIASDINHMEDKTLMEQTKAMVFEITALSTRLSEFFKILDNFVSKATPTDRVRWMEAQIIKMAYNINLVDANLNVAQSMSEFLFSKYPTVILCSATLTTNQKFEYFRHRLGLTDEFLPRRFISENIYDSPFDYQKQALMVIPADMPEPTSPEFLSAANERIFHAVKASRGHAFILFTSYAMLKASYLDLVDRLKEMGYPVFKQGDENRNALLKKFRNTPHAILFGTSSFWEGVDVAGDALRCVIIVKLPFKVPTEPLVQARTEDINVKGGNAFFDFSVPQAIVQFKQGFGRLIRNKQDRGCVVCLDSRLLKKGYGKLFLNSLPSCKQITPSLKDLHQEMAEFYKRTYHITQKKE